MSANATDAGSGVTDSASAISAPETTGGQSFDDAFRFTDEELAQVSITGDESDGGTDKATAPGVSDQGEKPTDQITGLSAETTPEQAADRTTKPDQKPESSGDPSRQDQPATTDALLEAVQKIGGADVLTMFTPLFQRLDVESEKGLNATITAGREFIEKLSEYDPAAATAALYGVYHTFEDLLTQWIDSKRGVTPELIEQAKTGKQADESDFPKPDSNNLVTLPEIGELDLTDSRDKALYDSKKAEYDRTRADEKKAADDKLKADQDAHQAAERKRDEAEKAFGKGRLDHLAQTFDNLKLNYGDEYDWLIPDIRSSVVQAVLADPKIRGLDAQGCDLARQGGARAAAIALEMDRLIEGHIKAKVEKYNNLMLRHNQAIRSALSGEPKLPEGTQTIKAGEEKKNTSQERKPKSIDDIFSAESFNRELGIQ